MEKRLEINPLTVFVIAANASVLAPTREHGAISPLQWSHTGDGVRPDQVCQAIRVYEESDGVRMNAKDLDRMNAYLEIGIDFELNRALSDMFVD